MAGGVLLHLNPAASDASPHRRLSSFPLVSGDSFAFACNTFPFSRPFRSMSGADDTQASWFVELSDLESPSHREWLLDLAAGATDPPTLVLHNGDLVPPAEFFSDALEVFECVYSVNIVDEKKRLRAIPIGLENLWHRGTGEFMDYLRDFMIQRTPEEEVCRRSLTLFAAFRVATNPAVRRPLTELLATHDLSNLAVDRASYRKSLRETLFVLSPPGNGLDCHRTWEAVYLGAVPVVLRSSFAPSLLERAPILAVDKWDDVLDLSRAELEDLYVSCRTSSEPGACLMPRWFDEIGVCRLSE